ncbi:pyridoxal phosphate-dependent decarboxylase family protein [Xenorhabdus hominickii]|uniref:Putative decarboxylase involved in desferrioxamine biosynthesis n=1 Tax=Xenorhabdus hominickii TaxID=351679 RepID=A0A2G0PYH1_XENHO|nr:pyridoxal-dependent decarboxylase [Xenorhabdus hominickii]AOM39979.1 tyrosine decarboxylase [Xenorhabdus hominickii]PHM52019.1 putative decarboxylase involved in desferrioxamine biosynthesis [Xenorhabdus hominickii]PHM52979.1 putative decarboxylase involved in desferrioxamine biosynthesis [Xenorhabdus hominickii]PHM53773.1 putative decarboxylase involved in desferrioxamine biosynthesis [Xenorhabdus hominickii]
MTKPFHPNLNIDALFLGPKSENAVFFREMMDYAVSEHIHWRSGFHPEDSALVTSVDRYEHNYRETLYQTEGILNQLSAKLKNTSIPFFSPRYLGHISSDTLMVSNLAYVMAMMYNPNNCSYESSPTTTELELESGLDLCRMFGYDPQQSWGHITSGGTVANYEGLWVARNVKTLPFAISQHPKAKDLLNHKSPQQLRNMSTAETLDLISELQQRGIFEEVRDMTCRGIGVKPEILGKLLVPQSKHYSWMKAADIFGIGQENIISLPVNENYQTDIVQMRKIVFDLIEKGESILAMIAVVGTTEVGAIDQIDKVIALRQECEELYGESFYIHVDAAYAGYACSMLLNEQGEFVEYDDLVNHHRTIGIMPEGISWPKPEVYQSFKALKEVDSITVDPHKVGFIQYAAGAICMKDKRILDLISSRAAYVFEEKNDNTNPSAINRGILGSSIMEGSKAGATAAALWAAHRLLPLNINGYGKIIAAGIVTAHRLLDKLANLAPIEVGMHRFEVHIMPFPDFHMINFTFKEVGNESLTRHNALNKRLYELCSYYTGRAYANDFLTSSTILDYKEYGDTPQHYAEKCGFSRSEWEKTRRIYVLRAAVMTSCLRNEEHFEEFWQKLQAIFVSKLNQLVDEEEKKVRRTTSIDKPFIAVRS